MPRCVCMKSNDNSTTQKRRAILTVDGRDLCVDLGSRKITTFLAAGRLIFILNKGPDAVWSEVNLELPCGSKWSMTREQVVGYYRARPWLFGCTVQFRAQGGY